MEQRNGQKKKKGQETYIHFIYELFVKKNYNNISVQKSLVQILEEQLLFSFFETKDFLLKELCEELFNHIMYKAAKPRFFIKMLVFLSKWCYFSAFIKTFWKENRMNIIGLLSSENNDIFLNYFKVNLKKLVVASYKPSGLLNHPKLSENFLTNHIAATFVETVHWWISNNLTETPEEMSEMFLIDPILKKSIN